MTFKEFWPRYLKAHSQPLTRGLHYLASFIGALAAFQAYRLEEAWIFLVGLMMSYAIAIGSHWFIEHNQPLIRVNAFYGAIANLRMCFLALTNRLDMEYEKYGIAREKKGVAKSGSAIINK